MAALGPAGRASPWVSVRPEQMAHNKGGCDSLAYAEPAPALPGPSTSVRLLVKAQVRRIRDRIRDRVGWMRDRRFRADTHTAFAGCAVCPSKVM